MINIPQYQLALYHGSELYKTYPVAVGKPATPSPVGDYMIINKIKHPVWYPRGETPVPPGPNNPLGDYWMGLKKPGYGIHGNNAAWSVGLSASRGCFRMKNQDVSEIYQLIAVGTLVKIIYQTIETEVDAQGRAFLEIFPDIYGESNLLDNVKTGLAQLSWKHQPHELVLQRLLAKVTERRRVEVPLALKITGRTGDAFLWKDQVYFESGLFLTERALETAVVDDPFCEGYLGSQSLEALFNGKYHCEYLREIDQVNLYCFTAYWQGEELEGLGRFVQGELWVNGAYLAQLLQLDFHWERENNYASLAQRVVSGLIIADQLWLPLKELVSWLPGLELICEEQQGQFELWLD